MVREFYFPIINYVDRDILLTVNEDEKIIFL